MAAPSADRINARAAKDRAFLKRALKNPGLRAKLDPKYLSGSQQKARALNTRLNAPITPGSSTTERDLAHAAQAATTVRYGPQEQQLGQQLGVAQTTERDTGSFYDQYLASLREHQANVAAFQQGAQQALSQTAAGITGLSGAQGAELQGQANQAAQLQGVTPAGNLAGMANDATAIRQALMGSIQGEQAIQGAAANTFADTQAHVVGPGQKLSAIAQARGRTGDVRKQIGALKTEEGAFNQSFRDTRRQDEFKNVLAQQTLGANIANQQTDNAIAASKAATSAAASSPEGQAAVTSAREEAKNAAKLGISVHQYRLLGPTVRKQRLDALKTKAKTGTEHTIREGAFAGLKPSQVDQMSPDAIQKRIDAYKKTGGGSGKPVEQSTQYRRDFRRKYGVDPLTTQAHNTLKNNVSSAQRALKLVGTKDKNGKPITTQAIVDALTTGGVTGVPKIGALAARVALEIARGGLTAGTANRLHHAGYSVATLGYKMGKPKAKPKPYRPPTSGPAASVPGLGGGGR